MISQTSSTVSTGTADAAATQLSNTSTDQLADKDTFLKLVVAQIQNQDPLAPQDSIQFVSQLAQFSQLEQSTEIRDAVQNIFTLMQAQAAQTSQGPESGSSQGSSSGSN